jgi:hypothetical protein
MFCRIHHRRKPAIAIAVTRIMTPPSPGPTFKLRPVYGMGDIVAEPVGSEVFVAVEVVLVVVFAVAFTATQIF